MTDTWNEKDHTRATTGGETKPGTFTGHKPTSQEIGELTKDADTILFTELNTRHSTPTQKTRIEKDLAGSVTPDENGPRTLRDVVDAGLTSKTATVCNGKLDHLIFAPANPDTGARMGYQVSRALWDAVEAPDERTGAQVVSAEILVLEHRRKQLIESGASLRNIEDKLRSARERRNMIIAYNRGVE